jgi:hypothetical protein
LEVANAMKEEMKRLKKEEKNKGMFMNIGWIIVIWISRRIMCIMMP